MKRGSSLLALVFVNFAHVAGVNYKNWLSGFSDVLLVNLPVLPGSHDSGAITSSDPTSWADVWQYAQTQNLTITQQLELGIRFLDLRLHVYYDEIDISNTIAISHLLDSNLTLTSVLGEVSAFLSAQPTEFVILYLRIDSNFPLAGDVASKQAYVQDTITSSSVLLSNTGSGDIATVRVSTLAGKVLILGPNGDVLPLSSSAFTYVDSNSSYVVCDIWQQATIPSAEATISACFPTTPLSGTVSGIINGYALDGNFNNLPPLMTSTTVNNWFFSEWANNPSWQARKTNPIGIMLIDCVSEEYMSQIMQVVSNPPASSSNGKHAVSLTPGILSLGLFLYMLY